MEQLGFSIAVPETMLIGFGIMIVIAIIILVKVLSIAKTTQATNDEVDKIHDRLKRVERAIEKKLKD